MDEVIFKIVYEKPTLTGVKQKEVIARQRHAVKFIKRCHRLNYNIISIQFT